MENLLAAGLFVLLIFIVLILETFFSANVQEPAARVFFLAVVAVGGVALIRSVFVEVRQRKMTEKLNKELQELDEARSEFISVASHQLRTPLTAIVGYMSMIREGDFGKYTKQLQAPLDRVFLSSKRLMNLIETLLDISRIESHRFEISPEMMDIVPIAQRLLEDFQIQARDKKLALTLDIQTPIPKIYADPLKIEDVLMNIIDNALKYTEKGAVTVRLASKKKSIQCCVADTGVGLHPTEIPMIFRRSVRGTGASKTHTEGFGMGLYIGERIVTAHGGKLWAESLGKNRGSVFCFTIPINRKRPSTNAAVKIVERVEDQTLS